MIIGMGIGIGFPRSVTAREFLQSQGWQDFPAGADYRRGRYWLPSLSAAAIATATADEIKRSVQFVSEAEWFSEFTRSSTALTQAADGTLVSVASDAPRFDFGLGRRALLLEGARTRLNADADNIGGAAWVLLGGATITPLPGKIGLSRWAIASAGADWHRATQGIGVTSGVVYVAIIYYEGGTSGDARLVFRDSAGAKESNVSGAVGALTVTSAAAGTPVLASDILVSDGVRRCIVVYTPNFTGTLSFGFGPDSAVVGETVNLLYGGIEQASFASANPILGANANTTRAIETMRLHPKVEALLGRDDWSALVRARAIGNVTDAPFLGGDASSAIIRSDNAEANVAAQSAASAELTIAANNAADFAALLANTASIGKLIAANGANASDADDFGAITAAYAGRDGAGLSSFARHDLHLFGPVAMAGAEANTLTATGWGA